MSWQRTKCIIPCCQASVKLFPERKFFRFPKPGTDKYDKWLAVLCDLSDIIKKRKCAYICDIHFEESSIGVKYLKSCAVPSLNLDEASFSALPPRLPTKPQIQEDWFRAILDETSQTVFSEDDLICSKHFSPDSFTTSNDGEQILKPSAIPFESLKKPGPELKRLKREKSTTSEIQCSVFSCEHSLSTTSTLRPQLIYHPFPSNEDLIEKWKQFCNKEDNDFAKSYICSDHFTDDDFVSKRGSGRAKTLKSQAIPSIYKREVATEEQSELESSNVSVDATYEPEVDGSTSNPSGDFETDETAALQQKDGRVCIIRTCQSHLKTIADEEFFPIPKQTNFRNAWIKIIQTNTKQTDDIPQNSVICSLHFTPDSFRRGASTKKILLPNALPSIFPEIKEEINEFPSMSLDDFDNPEFGKQFYEWSLKTYQEQKKTIQLLKERALLQSKLIARLAKSVDDFKNKKFVSEDANNALQNLFDKIVDAQYEVI